jgi:hypothetical protein
MTIMGQLTILPRASWMLDMAHLWIYLSRWLITHYPGSAITTWQEVGVMREKMDEKYPDCSLKWTDRNRCEIIAGQTISELRDDVFPVNSLQTTSERWCTSWTLCKHHLRDDVFPVFTNNIWEMMYFLNSLQTSSERWCISCLYKQHLRDDVFPVSSLQTTSELRDDVFLLTICKHHLRDVFLLRLLSPWYPGTQKWSSVSARISKGQGAVSAKIGNLRRSMEKC